MPKQGDVGLLKDPVAERLLQSKIPARLAYNWTDGTPRVVPIWFHWNGNEIIMSGPEKAPKFRAIVDGSKVALTIDGDEFPNKVLMVRGTASVTMVDGLTDEYRAAAARYFGEEQGKAWCDNAAKLIARSGRIAVIPKWVGVIDFETRFPSAISP